MKNTETWVLRYAISNQVSTQKQVVSTSFNYKEGKSHTLLLNGQIVSRPLTSVEKKMPIFLFEEHFEVERGPDGKDRKNRYLQKVLEVAKNEKESTPEQAKNLQIVKFLKDHFEVSWKNLKGEEQNPNFPIGAKIYYKLINLDEHETEVAELEKLNNEIIGNLIETKNNIEDFNNLAYAAGVNPAGLSSDQIFNILKKIIEKDPKAFKEKILDDDDKYYKMVINKGIRMQKSNNEPVIAEDENKNYKMNGILLAGNYDSLVIYFKDNAEMFEYLEIETGFKKKAAEANQSELKEKKPAGKPKAQTQN